MADITPAILVNNYTELKNKVAKVRGISITVQLDICDGGFVGALSWPMDEIEDINSPFQSILREEEGLPFWDEIDYELDLMVRKAHKNFDLFLKLGAKKIVFHLEAEVPNFTDEEILEFKEFLEGIDMYTRDHAQIGLAINVDTPIQNLEKLIHNVDYVQCMGIKTIGLQGEPFDERVFDQIKALRKLYPDLVITVDGGVSMENAEDLLDLGVSRLIIGSAIFNNDDVRGAIKDFESL